MAGESNLGTEVATTECWHLKPLSVVVEVLAFLMTRFSWVFVLILSYWHQDWSCSASLVDHLHEIPNFANWCSKPWERGFEDIIVSLFLTSYSSLACWELAIKEQRWGNQWQTRLNYPVQNYRHHHTYLTQVYQFIKLFKALILSILCPLNRVLQA